MIEKRKDQTKEEKEKEIAREIPAQRHIKGFQKECGPTRKDSKEFLRS